MKTMEYALENIVWYNSHYEWLEELAEKIENKGEGYFSTPSTIEWNTDKHFIWMLLVGMFGDWGTSIRSGWIEDKEECVKFIRELCAKVKEGEDDGKVY